MKTPLLTCLLAGLLLPMISCRPRDDATAKSADGPAKIDDSPKSFYFGIITATTPRTTVIPNCNGPFCTVDSLQLETVEPKAVFTFKVDTNTQIDKTSPDTLDLKFLEAAIKEKTIFAFKTAAYNGPHMPSHIIDITTNVVTGPINHFALDPTAAGCKDSQPFCKFSEIQITQTGESKPVPVDLSSETATVLPSTFTVQDAYNAKTPLYWALSRKEKGGSAHPLVVLIGLTAAIKP